MIRNALRQFLLAACLAVASCDLSAPALAQTQYDAPDQASTRFGVTASASGTTGQVQASLPAVAGKTTFICGFAITAGGATSAAVVQPTVSNMQGGTMTFTFGTPAGATASATPLNVPFTPCLPASAPNTAIVVTLPALGAGVTAANVDVWGYQY